jgi:hypothetical protein
MHRPPPEKSRFSIPEALMTIIVAAALIGGIYAVYKLAMRDKKVDAAIAQIDEIRQLDFTATDGGLKNPWDGNIRSEHKDSALSITIDSVPAAACLELAAHYTSADADFIDMAVNAHQFGEGRETASSETIAAACAEKDVAAISWNFR